MRVKNVVIILVIAVILGLGGKFYFEKRVVDSFKREFEKSSQENQYVKGRIGRISYSAITQTLTLEDLEFTPKDPNFGSGKLNIASVELSGVNMEAMDNANLGVISLETKVLDSMTVNGTTLSDDWGSYSKKLFVLKDPRVSRDLLMFTADPERIVKDKQLRTSYDVLEFIGNQIAFKKLLVEGAELNLKGEAEERLGIAKVSLDRYEIRDAADNMIGAAEVENVKLEGPEMKMLLKHADSKDTFLFGNLSRFPEYIISGKLPKAQSSITGFEMTVVGGSVPGETVSVKLADARFEQVFDEISAMKFSMNGFEIPLEDFKGQIDPAMLKVLADENVTSLNLDCVFDVQLDRANEEVSLNKTSVNIKNVGSAELRAKLLVKGILSRIRALEPFLQELSANPAMDDILGIEPSEPTLPAPAAPLNPLLVSATLNLAVDPALEPLALKVTQVHMPELTLEQLQAMRKQQAASAVMLLSPAQLPQLQTDASAFIEKLGSLEITLNPAEPVDLTSLWGAGPEALQRLNIKSVHRDRQTP